MEEEMQTTEGSADGSSSSVVQTAEASSTDDASGDISLSGATETATPEPAEDSGEPATKKAEAATPGSWQVDLQAFESRMNGLLAAKENLKLVAACEKLHSAYALSWKYQSNRYFQLVSTLRRRLKDGKVGGKSVA